MTTSSANVLVERRGATARLVIHRPPLNIINIETARELSNKLQAALGEVDVRLIELCGAGEKAFSAGTDVREHLPEKAPEMLQEFYALVRAVLCARVPTIAVVRGHCLGGGVELAMACDFVVASEGARFGLPEIKIGAFPPLATVLLPRLIPEKKALEMILTGEPISAAEAYRLGLVNRVSAAQDLEREADTFSDTLLAQSSQVLAPARKATRLGSRQHLESALRESERIYLEELLATEDAREGVRAYLEKRPPNWGKSA